MLQRPHPAPSAPTPVRSKPKFVFRRPAPGVRAPRGVVAWWSRGVQKALQVSLSLTVLSAKKEADLSPRGSCCHTRRALAWDNLCEPSRKSSLRVLAEHKKAIYRILRNWPTDSTCMGSMSMCAGCPPQAPTSLPCRLRDTMHLGLHPSPWL